MSNRDILRTLFDEKKSSAIIRAELDTINFALKSNDATITASSSVAPYIADYINDGNVGHIDINDNPSYWQSDSGTNNIVIEFKAKSKINRLKIFFYPKNPQINPLSVTIPSSFQIEYATTKSYGILGGWTLWSGLKDRSYEVGQSDTTISGGIVSGNTNTLCCFQDDEGVEAYGIRISGFTGTIRICEIEVWQTIILNEISRIRVENSRNVDDGILSAGIGSGTIIADTEEFYPSFEKFKSISINDVPNMRLRLYGGFNDNGVEYTEILGHYYIYDWTIFSGKKLIEFKFKDRIKTLKEQYVPLGQAILKDRTREWLLEWLWLKSGGSSDETEIFNSAEYIPIFYPAGERIWDEMNKLASDYGDIDLLVTPQNKLYWGVYLNSIPHEFVLNSTGAFEDGTLVNMATKLTAENTLQMPVMLQDYYTGDFTGEKNNVEVYEYSGQGVVRLAKQSLPFAISSSVDKSYAEPSPITETSGTKENTYDGNTLTYYYVRKRQSGFSLGTPNPSKAGCWVRYNFNQKRFVRKVNVLVRGNMGGNAYKSLTVRIHKPDGSYVQTYKSEWTGGDYWKDLTLNLSQDINLWGNYVEVEVIAHAIDVTIGNSTSDATAYIYEVSVVSDPAYLTNGTYISREFDSRCRDDVFTFYKFLASASLPAGTSIQYEIGTYSISGTGWNSIPSAQKQVISPDSIPTIPSKRFLKYKLTLSTTDDTATPAVANIRQTFGYSASFTSKIYDMIQPPTEWGGLSSIHQIPSGCSIVYKTQTSDDGINWDTPVVVSGGVIGSAKKRYLRIIVEMTRDTTTTTPIIQLIRIYYYTGSDNIRFQEPAIVLYEGKDIEDIPITFSNEDEGEKIQYNRVEVIAAPYLLLAKDTVWQSDIGWLAEIGRAYSWSPILQNPAEIDSDYRLIINGHNYPEGETTYGGLTVTFNRHPVYPFVKIVPLSNVTINEFYIEAKVWKQTSPSVYAVGEGNLILKKEGKYLVSSALAEQVSTYLYPVASSMKVRAARDMSIGFCPLLNFRSLIATVSDIGIRFWQVYSYTHDFDFLSSTPKISSTIKCQEFDVAFFQNPGYWAGREGIKPLYWGTNDYGRPRYYGGRLYG